MSVNIIVPELGESVVEATVGKWRKQEGDPVAPGDILLELETEKVNLEIAAERGGILAHINTPEGQDVKIGDVLGVIEEKESAGETQAPLASPPTSKRGEPNGGERTFAPAEQTPLAGKNETAAPEKARATPLAERVAKEYGVDLGKVPARGDESRITRGDVEAFVGKQQAPAAPDQPAAPAPATPASPAQLSEGRDRGEERVRLSRRRQTIARRLVEAQHEAAMLTTFNEVDMTEVMALRKKHQERFKVRYGVKLGYTAFFVKAAIGALKAFPRLNAELDRDQLVLKHYYDIGIAVGAEEGLVVPVLCDADRMSFVEIERAIEGFADKAEKGTLTLQDLRGGTFTITNGGVFGSLLSTPILNPPQVGILGLHKIEERPIALEGQVVVRPMMYVALTYDHRIVDGREAVQFLVRVKELIQEPDALLLES
jgi:2-oxoglutarate dehydrogenase E2 component (dihydrolipoamide succinyltransferase)